MSQKWQNHLFVISTLKLGRVKVFFFFFEYFKGFPGGTVVKNLPANAGDARDTGLIAGSGRSPGGGHDNLLQYYCLGNPVDREVWQAMANRVAKSRT